MIIQQLDCEYVDLTGDQEKQRKKVFVSSQCYLDDISYELCTKC